MRIFSYIFTALVTIFVINIALSFSLPSYRNALVNVRTSIFPDSKKTQIENPPEMKKLENDRLAESLDRIDKHIESLNEVKNTSTGTISNSGSTGTGDVNTLSGASFQQEDIVPKEPEIPLS